MGRSAVAASAYMSCSRMLNDYDGVQHDYTKKQGLVWQQVFLPPMAPSEWADREILWNAVEENEKTKDSRLAREFVISLPIELDRDEQIDLISDFIQTQFVAEGMCADVAVHDVDGHNPHAHIMLTVRPLNENGTWQHKTEKEYLCVKNGEERGFTAAEYKDAQHDDWEKQYPYWVTKKKKVYMTPSEAEAKGLERASKYAKSTKYGRQNPISASWNSDEQLLVWRKAWADAVNLILEHKGLDERIDHRSHVERGLDEQPTIYEGVIARAMEAKGLRSDRCELNRQIKADNARLRVLREIVEKLTAVMENTVAGIAAALEAARERIIVSTYGIRHIQEPMTYTDSFTLPSEVLNVVSRYYDELLKDIDDIDPIMMIFSLRKGHAAGIISGFAFSVYGFLLQPDTIQTVFRLPDELFYKANVAVGWLSPLNQATYHMHNFGYDLLPRMWQSFAIFGLLTALGFLLALGAIRNYNFVFTGTEG